MNKQLTRRGRLRAVLAGVAVAALAMTTVAACGSDDSGDKKASTTAENAEAAKLLPAEIKKAGVVRVASTFGYPPEQFYEEDGKTPTGFSVELGAALGKQLGVDFKFENVSFDAILPGIDAGRYDIAISSMSITPERSKQVNFVKYMDAGGSLLVKGDNPKHIEGFEDLCGKTAANTTGSLHGEYLENYSKENCVANGKSPIKVVNFSDAAAPNQAVATGRADVCYRDFTANAYMAQKSDGQFKIVGGIVKTSPYGIAVGKDDEQLAEAINVALNAVIQDGSYLDILKKWDVDEAAITQSEVVKATS
ncbi:MAG: ABC transporter substrate-binding protein [Nocardioidaceae bacterium]|nr:ABC transporter substrate-binding protein [Nocardioidaceae bacterium]